MLHLLFRIEFTLKNNRKNRLKIIKSILDKLDCVDKHNIEKFKIDKEGKSKIIVRSQDIKTYVVLNNIMMNMYETNKVCRYRIKEIKEGRTSCENRLHKRFRDTCSIV